MTTRKRIAFACVAMFLAFGFGLSALLAADLYFHRRAERFAGVNIWGYRGPRVAKKASGEHRLIVIGGSTAFGYGVVWDQTFAAYLERDLRPLAKNHAPVSVVNLGFNTQGAYAFRFVEEDYLGLDYDAVILYEGYNDVGFAPNEYVGRRDSPVFRLTGYYPIVNVALMEKAMSLRSGGNLEAAYRKNANPNAPDKTVFRPGLATRATASTLEAAARVSATLNQQLEHFSQAPPKAASTFDDVHVDDLGCHGEWKHYCASVRDGVRFALDHKKKVLVVTQPYLNERHRDQQAEMRTMLAAQFGSNLNVGYVDLGDVIDIHDEKLVYDGMHLNPDGNALIASRLVAPVTSLMSDAFSAAPAADSQRTAR